MTKYTTVSGDTFDRIAYDNYGSEAYMGELIAANEAYADTMVFGSGVELVLPEIDTSVKVVLPPWQR